MPDEARMRIEDNVEYCPATPEDLKQERQRREKEGLPSLESLGRILAFARLVPLQRKTWADGPVWTWHALKNADYERIFGAPIPYLGG
jgi:hypothetical protein